MASSSEGQQPGTDAHAQSSASDINKIDRFIQRGEEILDTFVSSIRAFEGQTLQIKSLATSVKEIKAGLKRPAESDIAGTSSAKKSKADCPDVVIDSDSGDSDVDDVMCGDLKEQQESLLCDMDLFFEEKEDVAEAIKEPVAKMINKNLRRTKVDNEKMKDLQDRYKRPANVEALQVPKVDRFLWNQLNNQVKTSDVAKQVTIEALNKTAGPLVAAMDHCYNNEKPDVTLLKQCIADSFKFICSRVNKINSDRREAIKKELDPRFRSLCSTETPVSATGLFGDNLQEQSKQLDASKQIRMIQKEPFLGQGRGSHRPLPLNNQYNQATSSRQVNRPGQPRTMQAATAQQKQSWPRKNYSVRFTHFRKSYRKPNVQHRKQ